MLTAMKKEQKEVYPFCTFSRDFNKNLMIS